MIFIDSNVPMYVIGAEHPNKAMAIEALERAVINGEGLVTDAEVFQELLHRYSAIGGRDAIGPAFDVLSGVVDEVLAIDRGIVDRARELVESDVGTSARDAIHVAVMRTHRIGRILSFDRGFDRLEGIERLPG